MAKIILGKRPKSFKRTITFQMPGEEAGTIEVLFRYRTRSEVAALTDELQAKIKVAIEKKEDVPAQTQSDLTARQNAFNVQYLLAVIDGWNLDVPFDKEAAEQLADELPSAVAAIVSDYRGALHEGRLGN
jgi:hypothetical protein